MLHRRYISWWSRRYRSKQIRSTSKVCKTWSVFNQENSELPNNRVFAIESDNQKGVWLGTGEQENAQLVHLLADDTWTIFEESSSVSPYIYTFQSDNKGGLWIAHGKDGFSHLMADGNWTIFNSETSKLPSNADVLTLDVDNQDNLWIGTHNNGIVYLASDGIWQFFNQDNSNLPSNAISALQSDSKGGVWVVTENGKISHLSANRIWKEFATNNMDLFKNPKMEALQSDKDMGLWIGTNGEGLRRLWKNGHWTLFNIENSSLPSNSISAFQANGNELWVGTNGNGLAHITFSQKTVICDNVDEVDCQKLQDNRRAAILIHPKVHRRSNHHEVQAVDFMATHVYQTLNDRGYNNDEIYFLSHKPNLDFNRDQQTDVDIVDAPVTFSEFRRCGGCLTSEITKTDIKNAFIWAKDRGKLDYPLIIVLIGHGTSNRAALQLNPKGTEILTVEELEEFLEDYQNTTGNTVVVIIEACYSGLFQQLSKSNRVIISSTTNQELAYYYDNGRESFLKFYFDELRQGVNFKQALQNVTEIIKTYPSPRNWQRPQFEDSQHGEIANTISAKTRRFETTTVAFPPDLFKINVMLNFIL